MADPYAGIATPLQDANPYAGIATPAPQRAPKPKDTETGSLGGDVLNAVNTGVNWLGTQATKAATGFAGTPRGLSDLQRAMIKGITGSDRIAAGSVALNPLTAVGQFLPSTDNMNDFVFNKLGVPEVNLPGRGGQVIDAATQAGLSAVAGPGNILRNIAPAVVGGGLQEAVGGMEGVKGTRWEPVVRLLTGVGGGVGTAVAQNAGGNALRGLGNLFGASQSNTDAQAARILGRALENDKTTASNMLATYGERGPGAMLIEAGGENAKGALRGSTAAPGPARTTVRNAFDQRLENEPSQTTAAIDAHVSNLPPVSTRTDALATARSKAVPPLYEASGIPRDRADLKNADRLLMTDDLLGLFKDSPDVQAALRNAKRVPELKGEPINSMAVLDRVYKHLEGLEQAARRSGNNTRAADLADIRKRFAAGIDSEKPQYGEARAAFSEPSKLIDAANLGSKLFSSNVHPEEVSRQYLKLAPDAREEFLGGVADYLRTKAGNSDRGVAAERIWGGENNRERLKAILPPDDFAALAKKMENTKNAIRTIRDVGQGSRTTPMALEAADNIGGTGNALVKAMRGHPLGAALDIGSALVGRVTEGRNQAVNNRLSEMLTTMNPAEAKAFLDAAERARLSYGNAVSGRRNALSSGAIYPAFTANSSGGASP